MVLEFGNFSDGSEGSPEHVESLIFTLTRLEGSWWACGGSSGDSQPPSLDGPMA